MGAKFKFCMPTKKKIYSKNMFITKMNTLLLLVAGTFFVIANYS